MKLDTPGYDRPIRALPASWPSSRSFAAARALADAVLFGDQVLSANRASATGDRCFHFGVLAPRAWSAAGGCESSWLEAQLLVRFYRSKPGLLGGVLRFLQLTRRKVERAAGASFAPVDALEVDGRLLVSWDEGEMRELELRAPLEPEVDTAIPFTLPGGRRRELVRDGDGATVARVTYLRRPLRGRVSVRVDAAGDSLLRVRVRVDNETPWRALGAPRNAVLATSCLSTHLLLGVEGAAFLSLTDPPAEAREAARQCASTRSVPALVGPPGSSDLSLCAPIALPDHAQIAPKNPAGVADRVEAMPPAMLERQHGAVREVEPVAREASAELVAGTRVRLRPGAGRTDAQNLLYAGRVAIIEKVARDRDGRVLYAVTLDGDPAAELHRWFNRLPYFYADEVEPWPAPSSAAEVAP